MCSAPATLLLPDLINSVAAGPRTILVYSFFKVGGINISLLFLLKAATFLAILVFVSHILQKLLLGRVFRYLHVSDALKFALGRFATYTFFAFGIFIGLQSLGVNLSSLVVFGGAVGVGVGLGLQNVVSNFVAGIILLIEQPIRLNDRVQTEGVFGDVVKIGARSTWVRTNENVVIIVPNNEFIQNAVTNWTVNDPRVRVSTPFGVSYNADPEQVRSLALEVARANPHVLSEPAPTVILTDFGDSTVDFALWVWTEARSHTPVVLKSELYYELFRVFRDHGVELPFPQRDLHIRSSDVPLPYPGPAKQPPSAV